MSETPSSSTGPLWPAARCRSCSASIVWAHTTAGALMPIDPHPAAGGNVRLAARDGQPPLAEVIGATIDLFDPTDDGIRHVAHWATCPDADAWHAEVPPT